MRLGLSSYTYNWAIGVKGHTPPKPMTLMDLLDKAVELGVRVLQLIDNLPMDSIAPHEWERFAEQAFKLGIELEVGTSGIGVEHLRRFIQLARLLRAPFVRIVVDTPECKPSEEEIVATLKRILPEFEEADLLLGIENHDRFKVQKWAEIIERLGSRRVGAVLDTTNSFGASQSPEAVVEALSPRTINLHLKDYVVQRQDHMLGFTIEGRPAGQGQLDIPWLLQKLKDQGRDPNVILELWTPRQATLAQTIEVEDSWATASVGYMRRHIPD